MLNVNSIQVTHSLAPTSHRNVMSAAQHMRMKRRTYTVSITIALLAAVTILGMIGAASWILKAMIAAAGAAVLVKVFRSVGAKDLTK